MGLDFKHPTYERQKIGFVDGGAPGGQPRNNPRLRIVLDSLGHSLGHHYDVFHAPKVGCNPCLHSRCGLDAAVNLHEVVDHVMQRNRVHVVSNFLLNALVNRVKRRMPMRIVRLARSTCEVLTKAISGLPNTLSFSELVMVAGL